jgi:hypothetical protein
MAQRACARSVRRAQREHLLRVRFALGCDLLSRWPLAARIAGVRIGSGWTNVLARPSLDGAARW